MLNSKEFLLAMQQCSESVWIEKQTKGGGGRAVDPSAHARGR